ncbi:MAG: hypothetical protein WA865_15500, partial [Spirulinaceae cyanobacterium]
VLIELKSSLQPAKEKKGKLKNGSLTQIENKFKCAINRIYLLLTLNNHGNLNKGYESANIHLDFRGIIAYNRNKIQGDDGSELCQILNKAKKHPLLSCSTILSPKDKIEVGFFANPDADSNSFSIALGDLLKK